MGESENAMGRILITGAGGQLGLTFQEHIHDFPEVSFDLKTSSELDIAQPVQLADTFRIGQYDFCINCAAYTNVENAEKHPEEAFAVNAEGVKNLAEICKEHGTTLIHISRNNNSFSRE